MLVVAADRSSQRRRSGRKSMERGREASTAESLDQPPASSDNKSLIFRVGDASNSAVPQSKIYFISLSSSDEQSIGEYNLVSREPRINSTPIPLYTPRRSTGDLPPSVSLGSTAAIAENVLYVMGGYVNGSPTTDVYSYDSVRMEWVKRPNMRFSKYGPQAFGLDGKIYVFGTGDDLDGPFVEVYSPQEEKWESASVDDLAFPEVEPILAVLTDTTGGKHILVQPDSEDDTTDLYTYSVANKTLTLEESCRPFQQVVCQSAVIDGILYCYRRGDGDDKDTIVGYDLTHEHIWAPIPVVGFFPHLDFYINDIQLLPLPDDTLCVMWSNSLHNRNGNILVFVMTFNMSKLVRNPETCMPGETSLLLQASHVSSRCYRVPGCGGFSDCLVI